MLPAKIADEALRRVGSQPFFREPSSFRTASGGSGRTSRMPGGASAPAST